MPGAIAFVNGILQFAGGFVLGFFVRGQLIKQVPKQTGTRNKLRATTKSAVKVTFPREELKMVLCVNMSLNMGKGKIAAQCAHASLGVYQEFAARHEVAFRQWEMTGQAKIVVRAQDEEELDELEAKAQDLGIPFYCVHDAGRTQIAAGSQTVLAVGPAKKSDMDKITGHLKLLS